MKYKEGDIVQVKSEGITVRGVVKKQKSDGSYRVQFDWGVDTVQASRIKSVLNSPNDIWETNATTTGAATPKSDRRRSPGRRSPSRQASTASPGRKKSPSRALKVSPTTESPVRKTSTPLPTLKEVRVSVERMVEGRGDSPLNKIFTRRRKPVETTSDVISVESVKENTFEFHEKLEKENILNETERVIHLKQIDTTLNDLSKLSDDDDVTMVIKSGSEKRFSEPPKSKSTQQPTTEFGYWFGTLLLIPLLPTFVIGLHLFCTRLPLNIYESLQLNTFFDTKAFILYFGYLFISVLVSLVPFGGRRICSQPSKDKKYEYNMNGVFTAFCLLSIIIGFEYNGLDVVDGIIDKYFQLLICAVLFAFALSMVLFVRSRFLAVGRLNKHAVSYNVIYDYFMGREVNPRILNVDVKMILIRTSIIAVLIFNSNFLYKSLDIHIRSDWHLDKIVFDPILITSCILQIVYAFDKLVFESTLTTTFELQQEGVGYMTTMMHSLYPFLLTTTSKYLYEHQVSSTYCRWQLSVGYLLFLIGYVLYRGSNSQKNAYRLNPYDPALSYLDSIPTSQGKKLLMSGYWGKLRHPNYAGDILMHLAFGVLCFKQLAALGVLPTVLLLVHRTSRDGFRCKQRYGSAWDRYCRKVQYQLIPKIY